MPETWLRNLLAVIHRDGGHYTEANGLERSAKDAEAIVLDLFWQIERHKLLTSKHLTREGLGATEEV